MEPQRPFSLTTPDGALDALRDRLRTARWPEPLLEGAGWDLGTDLEYLRELTAYWGDGFDSSAQEAALNELPHYRGTVDGLGIHFIHVPAASGSGFPLMLSPRLAGLVLALPEGRAAAELRARARTAATPRTHSTSSSPRSPASATRTSHGRRGCTCSGSRSCGASS